MLKGKPVDLDAAIAAARRLIDGAKHPVALVSSWGSNEELAAFRRAWPERFGALVKADDLPQPGERLDDDLLIRADKNPNTAGGARAVPGTGRRLPARCPAETDLVVVWGEGFDFARLPATARVIFLNSYLCARERARRRVRPDQHRRPSGAVTTPISRVS